MISRETWIKSADNAGAVYFKCVRIDGGAYRRYAKINDMVGAVGVERKTYSTELNKKFLAKKVKKKRKPKKKQKNRTKIDLYEVLIVATRKPTQRLNGSTLRFDENRCLTFTKPTTFGPAQKSTMIPNFLGTSVYGPVCHESRWTKWLNEKFKIVIQKARGIV